MKRLIRPLLLCLLVLGITLCFLACEDPSTGDLPPVDSPPTPDAVTLLAGLADKVEASSGRFSIRAFSDMETGGATLRVSMYAASDGARVLRHTEFSTNSEFVEEEHLYADGALREGDSLTPMTRGEYDALHGALSIPYLDEARLASVPVYEEIGGYCFAVAETPAAADPYLRSIMGWRLHDLYAEATEVTMTYFFHFKEDGELDRIDVRMDMVLMESVVFLTITAEYGEWGTALAT